MVNKPDIFACFEAVTATWQYLVADPDTHDTIDSVLDFNPASNQINNETADSLLLLTSKKNLQGKPRPYICIGSRIKHVQSTFASKYGIEASKLANVFDRLFQANENFTIGNLNIKVVYLPGYIPNYIGYLIGENIFTRDSIFSSDVRSVYTNFPGGLAIVLYSSNRTLLDLPGYYYLYIRYNYSLEERSENKSGEKYKAYIAIKEQSEENKYIKAGITEEDFLKFRSERDFMLRKPRLLYQSLQFNIRAGKLPEAIASGDILLHILIKASKDFVEIMQGPKW